MKSIDPSRAINRLVSEQPQPTRQRFDALFAAGDREAIVLATLPLIRKYNRSTPKHLKDDVESYAVGEVVKAVDRLLARQNANPGSYLTDVVRHAIHSARYGETTDAQQCSPSTQRLYQPRPRKSDAERDTLVAKLQQQGCSPQMIEAELSARGWDQSRILLHESEWPMVPHVETGEPVLADFGESPASNDDWELLEEICTDEELLILQLLSHGHTREYVGRAVNLHASTITKKLAAIRAKVQRHQVGD